MKSQLENFDFSNSLMGLAFGEDVNGAPAGPWFEATEAQAAAADFARSLAATRS